MADESSVVDITPITAEHLNALYELNLTVAQAINRSKERGLPTGLIVAILHGLSTRETLIMIADDDDVYEDENEVW